MASIKRLGFLLHSLELLNHFGSVLDLLPPGSFDLLAYGEEVSLDGLNAASRWGCAVRSAQDVIGAGDRYVWLVSNHPIVLGDQPLITQLADNNARFMYAAGKSGWNLRSWNELYQLILCFGPYHAEAFASVSQARIVQMGYPRFDRYFNETPHREALCKRFRCDPDKKTVVWLPTWKALSSVGLFNKEVSSLGSDYNVVVKVHPLMATQELDRVLALARYRFTAMITDASDNLPLYQLADYMLFDYGGPPMAATYVDKNMLLLNVPNAEQDEFTGADSPDILLRNHLISVNRGEDRIAGLLKDESVWAAQAEPRRMLREKYFAPNYGNASQIAATTLQSLLGGVA